MRVAQIVVGIITVALIVKLGFGAALLLLIGIAMLYVLAAIAMPISLRLTMRLEEKPAVRVVELDDASIPEQARAELRGQRDALGALGFEPRGIIVLSAGVSPTAYLGLFANRAHASRALARVALKAGPAWPALHTSEVEFEIPYGDGRSAELSNIASLVPSIALAPGCVRQMPQLREIESLHEYFLKLVTAFEKEAGLSATARLALPDDATATSVLYEQLGRSYAIQHRGGLMESAGVPGIWRPTWKMALMLAAAAISPGLEFVKRRLHARGDRLRRELDGDATRTIYERIGSRIGWLMVGIGTALGLLSLAMSFPTSSVAFVGIAVAWWVAKRGRGEPGWRAILIGGGVVMVLLGIPMGIPYADSTLLPPESVPALLPSLALFLFPMAALTAGTALAVEGFRAAAT